MVVDVESKKKEERFSQIVHTHQRGVYRLAFQLTGHHQDAEDLAQDVFIKVHRHLETYREEASIKTWIDRIVVNTYLNKRRKKALLFMKLRDDFDQTLHTNQGDPVTHASSNVLRRRIEAALSHLSPKERSAFALRHYQEYSVKEVAHAMDVAEGTVKSLLFRAVKKLRKQLAHLAEEV